MIQVGSKVRSHDFPDDRRWRQEEERQCYVEGVVEGFKEVDGCERYKIRVIRKVWAGKEVDNPFREHVYPPVNGTPKLLGGVCDGVELV